MFACILHYGISAVKYEASYTLEYLITAFFSAKIFSINVMELQTFYSRHFEPHGKFIVRDENIYSNYVKQTELVKEGIAKKSRQTSRLYNRAAVGNFNKLFNCMFTLLYVTAFSKVILSCIVLTLLCVIYKLFMIKILLIIL